MEQSPSSLLVPSLSSTVCFKGIQHHSRTLPVKVAVVVSVKEETIDDDSRVREDCSHKDEVLRIKIVAEYHQPDTKSHGKG